MFSTLLRPIASVIPEGRVSREELSSYFPALENFLGMEESLKAPESYENIVSIDSLGIQDIACGVMGELWNMLQALRITGLKWRSFQAYTPAMPWEADSHLDARQHLNRQVDVESGRRVLFARITRPDEIDAAAKRMDREIHQRSEQMKGFDETVQDLAQMLRTLDIARDTRNSWDAIDLSERAVRALDLLADVRRVYNDTLDAVLKFVPGRTFVNHLIRSTRKSPTSYVE